MLKQYKAYFNGAISTFLVFALAVSAAFVPGLASASTTELKVKDAESVVKASSLSLEEAEKELTKISTEYKALDKEISEMQLKIDELAKDVIEAQLNMISGREALSDAVRLEYKNSTSSLFLNLLLNASNFTQLTQNVSYVGQIMDYQSGEIAEQKRLREEFEIAAKNLNVQKAEQEAKLNALENKQAEAQGIVNRVSDELAENKEKLAAIKKQAEEIKKQEASVVKDLKVPSKGTSSSASSSASNSGATTSNSNNTNSSAGSNASNSTGGSSTGSSANGSNSSNSGSSENSGKDWITGVASAYGGSTDPYTNPNNLTANGSVCNDYSMGVAVPMSWPNYRSYFGRTVQIEYKGKVVYAVVNDCGYMGGGSRSLDLQPGVFKAFGYNSCTAWGLRTVKFRFL